MLAIFQIYRCALPGCDGVWREKSRRRYCSDACKQIAYRDRHGDDGSTSVEMRPLRSEPLVIDDFSARVRITTHCDSDMAGWVRDCLSDDHDRFVQMYGHHRSRTPIPRIDRKLDIGDDDVG